MNNVLLIRKIQALLHDPPEKPIILGRIGHEGRAKEIMRELIGDAAAIPEDIKTADHIASAADRINLPRDERFISDFLRNPEIIHSLSGKGFNLGSLAQINIDHITDDVDRAVGELADKYRGDSEKIYLSLWRSLVDMLIEDGQSNLGQLWELLPADTRIPDHSIWEHKRVTSAIAGALPKPAFLLFAIGPVQEFIATARKTQDLWAGSYLLSYLSWSAMKVVAEEFGPDCLIFPDLHRQPFVDKWLIEKGLEIDALGNELLSSPTLPNRFLAVIPAESVKDIAEKAKKHVQETFASACRAVKEKMSEKCGIHPSAEWDEIWQRQTDDFIETYWSATVIDEVEDIDGFIAEYKRLMGTSSEWPFDNLLRAYERGFKPNIGTVYAQIYRLTEKTLGSRKAIRDFKQQDEPNHKCTLCGLREPVHPGMFNNQTCREEFGALTGFWRENVMPAFPQIRRTERLCGICVTKRLAASSFFREQMGLDISNSFPSVSMVATASFKEKVIKNISHPEINTRANEFIFILNTLFEGKKERMNGEPLPMVRRMCNNPGTVALENKDIAHKFASIEGDWLYEDSFRESLKDDIPNYSEELCNAAQAALKKLLQAAKKIDIDQPSKYYAVFLMDGDNMGKWLSGENAPTIGEIMHPIVRDGLEPKEWDTLLTMKRPLNPSLHLATSKALRDFSLHVAREIVEKDHLGKLVYAGGDDVLAFVNLKDLPEVMRKLRACFSGSLIVNEETSKVDIDFKEGRGFIPVDGEGVPLNIENNKNKINGFRLSMGTKATASMGVVIAHHNSNLAKVLDDVRRCEKEAKNLKDKNAFCISLAKRSGGTESVSAKWYYDSEKEGIFEPIPLLREWADAFYNDHMSPKMVYTFRTETTGLEGKDLPRGAVRHELLRIADRQRIKKNKGFNKETMEKMVVRIIKFHESGLSLEKVSVFLSVAAFLGREGNR
ncbi:MAG: type III-B CRISPR-associated protein Cas10/Cmr2 [Nitrospirae bacterium]|nr:type III-B CRISPR-associated protein Cas10/Cmr2 [Nitrospirota bacterium]